MVVNVLDPELERGLGDILARGGCVFPICPDSKLPLPLSGQQIGKPGKGGHKLATNDPRVVWHYFRGDPLPDGMPEMALRTLMAWRRTKRPNAAVALDMSGMLVLDADSLDELESFRVRHGNLPATYCVRSPRSGGGLHYYFRVYGDASYRRIVRGFPHLDIKHHGYVLIAGSARRERSGDAVGRYVVVDDSPIADLPKWLSDLIEMPLVATAGCQRHPVDSEWGAVGGLELQRARAYLAKMPPAISGHGGHNATFAAARALVRGFALSEDDAYDILESDYNPRCEPPWSAWELRHKVRSAMESSTMPIGHLLEATWTEHQAASADQYDIRPMWG